MKPAVITERVLALAVSAFAIPTDNNPFGIKVQDKLKDTFISGNQSRKRKLLNIVYFRIGLGLNLNTTTSSDRELLSVFQLL